MAWPKIFNSKKNNPPQTSNTLPETNQTSSGSGQPDTPDSNPLGAHVAASRKNDTQRSASGEGDVGTNKGSTSTRIDPQETEQTPPDAGGGGHEATDALPSALQQVGKAYTLPKTESNSGMNEKISRGEGDTSPPNIPGEDSPASTPPSTSGEGNVAVNEGLASAPTDLQQVQHEGDQPVLRGEGNSGPPNNSTEEEERSKHQALREQTAFIGGGKKGLLDKLGWPKRQEKGNDNTLLAESFQKRRWRLGNSAKAVSLGIDDLSDDQVIIAVMGPTGAGKSSFIAKVTGGDVAIGHELQSCTTEIKIIKYECPDRSDFDVVFVDTPGFDDTERSDVEILEMIADWLNKTYERKIILAGILYFHRISDNRMAGTPLKNLKMFRELCGKNALQNIILTTTMWDEVDLDVGTMRETELRSKYWKAMIDHGSATARFHSTQDSAWDIVDHFVRDSNARHAVLLQNEMSEMKKQLPETNAGQKLYTELEVLVHKQQATLKKIREETKQHADPAVLDALKAEYDGLRTQLAKIVNDMEAMKLPLGRRILRLIWGPMFGSK